MPRYIVANWKCHKSGDEGKRWFDRFAMLYRPHPEVQVVVASSVLLLENLAAHAQLLGLVNVSLAAQDVSPFPRGAYTGAVAADMVAGLAHYVIVGHSERRRYFRETHMDVANKVVESLDAGLVPIVCVDASQFLAQLGVLEDTGSASVLVAYTPAVAAASRRAEEPFRVGESVDRIKKMFHSWPIIYGGAVTPANADDYLKLPQLSGVLVGEASLDPKAFADICRRALPGTDSALKE